MTPFARIASTKKRLDRRWSPGDVFCDTHHAALARSLFYLFADRLDGTIWFPSPTFVERANRELPGTWGHFSSGAFLETMGGIDRETWSKKVKWCDEDEFADVEWDAVVVSRSDSVGVLRPLVEKHRARRSIATIAYSGNQREEFDWSFAKNLLSSDWATWYMAPNDVHKLLVTQEIGRHFSVPIVQITRESLPVVGCFCHNVAVSGTSETTPDRVLVREMDEHFRCPHCFGRMWPHGEDLPGVDWSKTLADVKRDLDGDVELRFYGRGNAVFDGTCATDAQLPEAYASCSAVIHFKSAEGYGHSAIQAVASGRPIVCRHGFFRYKTAGRCSIPEVTCWETGFDWRSVSKTLRRLTSDLEKAQRRTEACRKVFGAVFDWEEEAADVAAWGASLRRG